MTWINCPYCGEEMEGMSHECLEGRIAQLEAMSEWINVEEKVPEEEGRYLIFAASEDPRKPFIYIAWYNPDREDIPWELIPDIWGEAVTHWMKLPDPPLEAGAK